MKNNVKHDVNKNVNKNKYIAIFCFLLFLFLFFEIPYHLMGIDLKNQTNVVILTYIKYFVFIFLFILFYHKYLVDKFKDFKKNFIKHMRIGFKWWFIGFIIMVVSNNIISRFVEGVGTNEETVQSLLSSYPILMLIATTFFAPFIEEMLFRKSLQDCFKNKLLFILTSGLIFGLLHVANAKTPLEYLFIIPYGAFGSCFAKALVETDNIYTTILVHMLHNGVLALLSVLLVIL